MTSTKLQINLKKQTPNIKLVFLFFILLIACNKEDYISSGQADSFIKFFGTSLADYGFDVKQTGEGGYVFIGTTTTENNGTDMLLVKTDEYGNQEWAQKIGGEYDDNGYSLQIASDGGYILLGSYTGTAGGTSDMYLVKTGQSGDTLWTKKFGGNLSEEGYCIELTNDGGYILAGYTESFGYGAKDIYLVKTNQNGDTLWTNTFGGTADDIGNSVVQKSDNSFVIAGNSESFSEAGQDGFNVILITTNENGFENDKITFGGTGNDYGNALRILPGGGYVIIGSTSSYGAGLSDIYLMLIGEDIHTSTVTKTFGGSGNDYGNSIQVTDDNGFVIIGTHGVAGNSTMFLIKTDLTGIEDFSEDYGGVGNETGEAVEQTSDGGFIIIGSSTIEGNSMISLVKTKPDGGLNPD